MFRAGLIARSNRDYQKDSPDFVVYGLLNGVHVIATLEMKARCTSKTAARERRKNNFSKDFTYMSCYSSELRKYVVNKKEAAQVRH